MRETDLAWAAGIIDGEGAVSMSRARAGVNRRVTESFQVRVNVKMTHEPTIRRLYEIFGGVFKPGGKVRNPEKHKATYEWYVGDLKAAEALRRIVPYTVTKRDQVLLVLEYRERCCSVRHLGRGATCSSELVELRRAYFGRLRELNRKGPRASLGE